MMAAQQPLLMLPFPGPEVRGYRFRAYDMRSALGLGETWAERTIHMQNSLAWRIARVCGFGRLARDSSFQTSANITA